jgi:hypothetical protein
MGQNEKDSHSTYIVRLLSNRLELLVRDHWLFSPCTPLCRLVSLSDKGGSGSGSRSESRSGNHSGE